MNKVSELSCRLPSDWMSDPSLCLFEWQGLEAGALALAAAILGAYFLNRQTRQARQIEDENRLRHFRAVRASLPLVLAETDEFCREVFRSMESAKTVYNQSRSQGLLHQWSAPSLPENLTEQLREFIEATDNENAIALVTGLFQQMQTLSSRIESLTDADDIQNRVGVRLNFVEYQIQAATICAMVEALFPFSRNKEEKPPATISREKVLGVLSRWGTDQITDPTLHTSIERFSRIERPAWPREND